MKKTKRLIMIYLAFTFSASIWAESREVINERSLESTLKIRETTYIPNIMGYACPVPAINLERYMLWNVRLNHRGFGDFGVDHLGLRIVNPNMRFCTFQTAQEIFGETFEVGNEIKIKIIFELAIVTIENEDGEVKKDLVETISSEINGIKLHSQARVNLN